MAQISMIIEPGYAQGHWAQAYAQGIREEAHKRGLDIALIAPRQAPAGQPLLVLGSGDVWLRECVAFLEARGVPCVLAGAPPEDVCCSFAAPDYEEAMARFAALTQGHPAGRRALFAIHPDSAADRLKRAAFLRHCPQSVVFENTGSLLTAARALAGEGVPFDTVLCANDVAAMVLRRVLRTCAVAPSLYAFGDQELPGEEEIGVFRMDLAEVGRQAVHLYRAMAKEGDRAIRRCHWVHCGLGGPPRPWEDGKATTPSRVPVAAAGDFYQDPQVPVAFQFKALLRRCDALDLDILRELLAGRGYEAVSENLHTTEGTIKYRLRRMMEDAGVSSRQALLELARDYLSSGSVPR